MDRYPVGFDPGIQGIGMTSMRTRQRLAQRLRRAGVANDAVLDVIVQLPRHVFIDEALASRAYEDIALPIGFGQTISQPYVVALMTQTVLESQRFERVLEIGTGSGYQTAVLASLAPRVYSVERVAGLLERARRRLQALGFHNVRLRHGDGHEGWMRHGPFDAIVVTAAAEQFPAALSDQLAVGGGLVAPVGPPSRQVLIRMERRVNGFEKRALCPVSFVPLLSGVF